MTVLSTLVPSRNLTWPATAGVTVALRVTLAPWTAFAGRSATSSVAVSGNFVYSTDQVLCTVSIRMSAESYVVFGEVLAALVVSRSW